jgi:DNA-binding NtrC family response regulator
MTAIIATRLVEGERARLEHEATELKVVAGPDRGQTHALGTDSVLIGSARQCDLVLHDTSVSARHAEIVVTTDGYALRDLKSTNGVMLGSHRVERVPLCDGMRVRLGDTALSIRALGKRVSVPLAQAGRLGPLVAHSVKMRAFVATLAQLANSEITVLLEGETGTGKEVAAQTLHEVSSRRLGPFVVLDCGAVSRSLMAAEIFGHEKGAFTGANDSRPGVFEQADGGTLFLDEIGELPLELQPYLLAALERKSTRRVGGKVDLRHDVRVVAATNRNLAEEVRAGRFRQDLYFRLAVARLRLPPLRERAEDLPLLAEGFAREAGVILANELLVPLTAYDWPGNVRELKNTIQRMSVEPLRLDGLVDLPVRRDGAEQPDAIATAMFDEQGRIRTLPEVRRLVTEGFERRYLERVLEHAMGNLSRAAEIAGVTRQSLTELAVKHRLHSRGRGNAR